MSSVHRAIRGCQRGRLQIPDQPMILNRQIIHRFPSFPCCAAFLVVPLLGLASDGSAAAGDLSPPARRFHLGELPLEPVGKGPSPRTRPSRS